MPLNITAHSQSTPRFGAFPATLSLGGGEVSQVVALGAQSAAITGPATLVLIADEGQRVALTKTPGYVSPGATGMKMPANAVRHYDIPAGSWYLNCVAG